MTSQDNHVIIKFGSSTLTLAAGCINYMGVHLGRDQAFACKSSHKTSFF
jgi:hypothetical protein